MPPRQAGGQPLHPICPQFRDGLGKLVADRDLRLRMGRAARARAETFSLDWYAAQLVPLLARLVRQQA